MSKTPDSNITDQQNLAQATLSRIRTDLNAGQMSVMSKIVRVICEISEKARQVRHGKRGDVQAHGVLNLNDSV